LFPSFLLFFCLQSHWTATFPLKSNSSHNPQTIKIVKDQSMVESGTSDCFSTGVNQRRCEHQSRDGHSATFVSSTAFLVCSDAITDHHRNLNSSLMKRAFSFVPDQQLQCVSVSSPEQLEMVLSGH
jgi:hypothetical protein